MCVIQCAEMACCGVHFRIPGADLNGQVSRTVSLAWNASVGLNQFFLDVIAEIGVHEWSHSRLEAVTMLQRRDGLSYRCAGLEELFTFLKTARYDCSSLRRLSSTHAYSQESAFVFRCSMENEFKCSRRATEAGEKACSSGNALHPVDRVRIICVP